MLEGQALDNPSSRVLFGIPDRLRALTLMVPIAVLAPWWTPVIVSFLLILVLHWSLLLSSGFC